MSKPEIVSPRKHAITYIALMTLFGLTFVLAHFDLGHFNVAAGLTIAAAKAILVVLYFMQLRHSNGLNRVIAGVGVFWLGILLVLSLSDVLSRNWLLLPGHWP